MIFTHYVQGNAGEPGFNGRPGKAGAAVSKTTLCCAVQWIRCGCQAIIMYLSSSG